METTKQGQKPAIQSLSKEDLTKLSSLIEDNIIKGLKLSARKAGAVLVPNKIGAIFSMGTFMVAMMSLLIAVYSFSSFNTNRRLNNLEKGQANLETELKEFKIEVREKFDKILERLPEKN